MRRSSILLVSLVVTLVLGAACGGAPDGPVVVAPPSAAPATSAVPAASTTTVTATPATSTTVGTSTSSGPAPVVVPVQPGDDEHTLGHAVAVALLRSGPGYDPVATMAGAFDPSVTGLRERAAALAQQNVPRAALTDAHVGEIYCTEGPTTCVFLGTGGGVEDGKLAQVGVTMRRSGGKWRVIGLTAERKTRT